MRFALDDAGVALREAARDVLARETGPAAWRKLAAAGVTRALAPEDRGGLGLSENALVPLLDEIGYAGLIVPAAETIAVAAPLVPAGLGADALVACALDGTGLVPYGSQAQYVLIRTDTVLRLYPREALSLNVQPVTPGFRPVARLDGEPGSGPGMLLTDDPVAVHEAWQRGVLGTSALLTGLSRRMLDMTVAYVKQREQFGVPVGSFQAVKHKLADALVAIEFTRPLVLAAAWAQANRTLEATALTSAAKARAADTARLVARTALQCHGAMGYTTEYELHRFAKQAWALAPAFGTSHEHRSQIAREIGVADG